MMKRLMKIGEYTRFAKKTFRCVADNHSQSKRCILCDLRPYGLCDFVCCQPDERSDRQSVVFRLTSKRRKGEDNEEKNFKTI